MSARQQAVGANRYVKPLAVSTSDASGESDNGYFEHPAGSGFDDMGEYPEESGLEDGEPRNHEGM
jgi:hypothetical protein